MTDEQRVCTVGHGSDLFVSIGDQLACVAL
jgi:hypothetical protein